MKQGFWAPVDHVLCGTQWKAVAGESAVVSHHGDPPERGGGMLCLLVTNSNPHSPPCSPQQRTLRLSSLLAVPFPSLCAAHLSLVLLGLLHRSWPTVLIKIALCIVEGLVKGLITKWYEKGQEGLVPACSDCLDYVSRKDRRS